MRFFVFVFGGVCPASYGQAQGSTNPTPAPARTLTLAQAEALALNNNPQIAIGKLRALEAQQYIREARSPLLPTAYLSLTGADSEVGSRVAAGGFDNPVIFPRAAAGATVSQLITDFGRTTNLRAVSLSLDATRARLYHLRSEASLDFGLSLICKAPGFSFVGASHEPFFKRKRAQPMLPPTFLLFLKPHRCSITII